MKKFFPIIIALACLSILLNVIFFIKPVEKEEIPLPKKAKNIILLIGDGMGVNHIFSAMTVNHGKLNIERCTHCGFSKTQSSSNFNTDSGASGTAMSTGKKTFNHAIGVDSDSIPLKSVLEYAEENGLNTGLVSTSAIVHATPASFIAHNPNRYDYENIALDFLNTDVDLLIGGGMNYFRNRTDSVDLTKKLIEKGYKICQEMDCVDTINSIKLAAFLAEDHLEKWSEGRGNMLPNATNKAIELLNSEKGFFLLVEGSQIDWAGHDNDAEYLINETLDFDRAVAKAIDFAEKDGNTLVIVTADHETGGVTLLFGNNKKGKVLLNFSTNGHTGVMTPVFAYGPCAENFSGVYENTELFHKMMESFGFEKK